MEPTEWFIEVWYYGELRFTDRDTFQSIEAARSNVAELKEKLVAQLGANVLETMGCSFRYVTSREAQPA